MGILINYSSRHFSVEEQLSLQLDSRKLEAGVIYESAWNERQSIRIVLQEQAMGFMADRSAQTSIICVTGALVEKRTRAYRIHSPCVDTKEMLR